MSVQQGVNDLYTWCLNNGERGQRLLKEWQGMDEDGIQRDIHKIGVKSGIRMLWKCSECNNEWHTRVYHRTINGYNCRLCLIKRVQELNRNRALKPGINDLYTWCLNNSAYGNQIIQEWTGLDEDDNAVDMNKITYGSGRKVKWQCKNNHTWIECVDYRTCKLACCPYCSKYGTSYIEQFIYWTLKQLYPNTENRCRVLKSPENPKGIEFDIGVPDIPLCIEYSPTYWHNGKEKYDNYKKGLCEQRGIRFIQIIDDSHSEFENIVTPDYICIKIVPYKRDEILTEIMDYILKSIGHSISEVDLETVKDNAWKYSHGDIEYEKSLAYTHPELAKEWHPTLNTLKPTEVTHGNNKKFYWQCTQCGYGKDGEWLVTIKSRASYKYGTRCPWCGYHWKDKKIHKGFSTIVAVGINDLATTHPELVKEWHPTLNKLKPTEIKAGHTKKVFWQCIYCGYGKNGEWQALPSRRTLKGYETRCPCCGYHWKDKQIHKTYNTTVVIGFNDLATTHPERAKEWHPTLNTIKPTEIKYGSRKLIYWQCTKCEYGENGEWKTTPIARAHNGHETGCPQCGYNWHRATIGAPQRIKVKYQVDPD